MPSALQRDRDLIASFKQGQQAAFDAERRRWAELRIDEVPDESMASAAAPVDDIPDGHAGVFSEVPGNVWKIFGDEGAQVAAGDVVAIIEIHENGNPCAGPRCRPSIVGTCQTGTDIARGRRRGSDPWRARTSGTGGRSARKPLTTCATFAALKHASSLSVLRGSATRALREGEAWCAWWDSNPHDVAIEGF